MVHYCMADGIGGNDLMTQVFDTGPDQRPPELTDWVPAPRPSLAELAADDPRDAISGPLGESLSDGDNG
jgi:Wax ester synthase/diacylglycerol acyltransferase catalytic domain